MTGGCLKVPLSRKVPQYFHLHLIVPVPRLTAADQLLQPKYALTRQLRGTRGQIWVSCHLAKQAQIAFVGPSAEIAIPLCQRESTWVEALLIYRAFKINHFVHTQIMLWCFSFRMMFLWGQLSTIKLASIWSLGMFAPLISRQCKACVLIKPSRCTDKSNVPVSYLYKKQIVLVDRSKKKQTLKTSLGRKEAEAVSWLDSDVLCDLLRFCWPRNFPAEQTFSWKTALQWNCSILSIL